MNMRRNRAFLFANCLLIAGMLSAFCACVPETADPEGETAKGFSVAPEVGVEAVVSEAYQGKDEAAQAFVEKELSGVAAQTAFVSYTKEADLTQAEKSALGVGEAYSGGEKGYVSYTATAPAQAQSLAEGDQAETERHSVVLLYGTNGEISYCVAPPQIGEAVPKSYFDAVYSFMYADNVTLKGESLIEINMGGFENNATLEAEIRVTESALYEALSGTDEQGMSPLPKQEIYAVQDGDRILSYCKADGETWENGNTLEGTITDFYKSAAAEAMDRTVYVDHTYYVRTEKGCELDVRKRDQLVRAFLDQIPSFDMFDTSFFDVVTLSMEFQDGKLYKIEQEIGMNLAQPDGTHIVIRTKSLNTCSDYGTTKVELPDDLKEFIAAQE